MFDNKLPKSFQIELKELHCNLYFVFVKGDQHPKQLKQATLDLQKLGYVVSEECSHHIDEILKECTRNPAFTFELDDTNIAIFFRIDFFISDTFMYFTGILAHEINHAVTFIFENLGILQNDDELRSIEIGNIVEESLTRLKSCFISDFLIGTKNEQK